MGAAAPSGAKPLAQDNNTAADYYTSSYSHCACLEAHTPLPL